MLIIDTKKCTGCRLCEKDCPAGAINVIKAKASIDHSKCKNCYRCISICPNDAIKKIKRFEDIRFSNKKSKELSLELCSIQEKITSLRSGLDRLETKK